MKKTIMLAALLVTTSCDHATSTTNDIKTENGTTVTLVCPIVKRGQYTTTYCYIRANEPEIN
jgi:hypothetical protein